jgi:hypothetical protein
MKVSKTAVLFGIVFIILFVLAVYSSLKLKDAFCERNRLEKENLVLKDSINTLQKQNDSLNDVIYDKTLFELQYNGDALDYLDEQYQIRDDWQAFVIDKLMETNSGKGDNPLIPHAGMYGRMKINSVRVLNHKWLIFNFSDGKAWGEAIMEYEPVGKDSIRFEVIKSLIYPIRN